MAIKIPSKHIYSINNQKVIDNQVDKIEIPVKVPQLVNAMENVYNEQLAVVPNWEGTQPDHNQDTATYNQVMYSGYAYVEETPSYITKTFRIPNIKENSSILRILTGKNDLGEANIKYTISGDIIEGTSSGSVSASYNYLSGNVTYGEVIVDEPIPIKTVTDTRFTLTPNFSYPYKYYDAGILMRTITVDFKFSDRSNILDAKAELSEDGKNFVITLTILNGLKIIKMGGGAQVAVTTVPLKGEYEEYIPKQIDISFYGDTIKLDLQEKTITIGNGTNVISFSGNELMQTTNNPTI